MKRKMLTLLLSVTMIFSSATVYAEPVIEDEITEAASEDSSEEELKEYPEGIEENTIPEIPENITEDTDEKQLLTTDENSSEQPQLTETEEEVTETDSTEKEINPVSFAASMSDDADGEISVGDKITLQNPGAGKEYKYVFRVPATKRYRIYLTKNYDDHRDYNDTVHVYTEDNREIEASEDESWYLTEGDTVTVSVVCDDEYTSRYSGLHLRLIEYIGIESVTADFPERILRDTPYDVVLHINYTNGAQEDVQPWSQSSKREEPVLHKFVGYGSDDNGNLFCVMDNQEIPVGNMSIVGWRNPEVYQITEMGRYTVDKEELFAGQNGRYLCLDLGKNNDSQAMEYYKITITGNVNNPDTDMRTEEGYSDSWPNYKDEGVVYEISVSGTNAKLIRFREDLNSSYTINIEKNVVITSMNIELNQEEYTVSSDLSVSADILIEYSNDTSEVIPVEFNSIGVTISRQMANGQTLTAELANDSLMPLGVYSLTVNTPRYYDQRFLTVFPVENYQNSYDALIELDTKEAVIPVSSLDSGEYCLVRLEPEINSYYYLSTSNSSLKVGVYEENEGKLIPCYKRTMIQSYNNRIKFEKDKSYYLVCMNTSAGESTTEKDTVTLEELGSEVWLENAPSDLSASKELEDVKIHIKSAFSEERVIPLISDRKLTSDPDVQIEVKTYDPTLGWNYVDVNAEDVLEFFDKGSHSDIFREGVQYELEIICCKCMITSIGFVPKGDGTITEQPQDVTAGVSTKISFSVKADNAATYQWQYSKDGGTTWSNSTVASAKTDTLELTVSKSNYQNIYRCKVTGKKGTVEYSDSAAIDLIPWSEITVQPESPAMINGETVKFHCEATNAASYQWQYSKDGTTWKNSTLSSAKTDTLSIKVSDTNSMNIYRCQVTGIDGNKVNSSKAVFVLLTQQPEPCSAPLGTKASYTIKAENAESYQWQYSKDGGVTWSNSTLTSAKTDTLTFTVAAANQANLYRCKMKTTTGVYAYTKPVGYVDELKITSQPSNITVEGGASATFKVAATGKDLTYQWQYSKDGGKTWINSTVASAKTATLKVAIQASYDGRLYRCVIKDGTGKTVNSNGAKVTIAGTGPVITSQPTDKTAAEGKAVYFKVVAEGENLTYQWQYSKDNGATWTKSTLSTATTASLKVTAQTSQNGRLFRCVITDGYGKKVTSAAAKLTVK